MPIRGKWLAWFGLPLTAALLVVLAFASPRPVPEARGPLASSSAPQGVIAVGSPAPGGPATGEAATGEAATGAGATTSPPGSGPTPAPSVLDATRPQSSAPSLIPPTAKPTAAPTLGPSVAPPVAPTQAPTAPPATAGPIPSLSACAIFPSSNVWNRPVDGLPVAPDSATMIAAIGLNASLHPDFSDAGGYGIPFNVVGTSTPRSTVAFQYDDESDHVGYPIPDAPKIEGGSDRHLLMVDTNACVLYELFAAAQGSGGWTAGSGAVWELGSNDLRPAGWTSGDAAGLPIFPGLVRYPEVAAGAIHHAIRFTAPQTCDGYVYPARHEAGSGSCSTLPPMGLRVRLKASVDISGFGPQSLVILTALQQYGMLLADNGSPWYITGAPDGHWDDDELHRLGEISGSDFEVVDTAGFVNE
jgi:hypothetical protein